MRDQVITFYYSITSRYSYLASTQIDELAAESGCAVAWVPVDAWELRKLADSEPFKGPPPSGQYRSPYRERDLQDWVEFYGIPYREPPEENGDLWWKGFDRLKTRMFVRAAVAGQRLVPGQSFAKALFALMFASDVWPIDEGVICELAADNEMDRADLARLVDDPQIDAALTANAQRAVSYGVFGVPSFIFAGKMFFGNDRLPILKHHIAKETE